MNEQRHPRVRCLVVLVFALCWSTAPPARVESSEEDLGKRLDQLLTAYEQYGFSGTVLVSRQGRVALEKGYGFANRETGERNTAATRFDFASIAKTFTGAAVLALEAEGKLTVTDPLENFVGSFSDKRKSSATIRHLATHTAGLAHRSKSELEYSEDRARWIQSMKDAPFESEPGDSYRYSNAGASFLAAVVEEVAGEPFETVVRERLFEPVGMNSTGFWPEFPRGATGVALGYEDESTIAAPSEYDGWTWGAKGATGIISTVGDMYTWFQAMYQGDLLTVEQRSEVFDPEETEAYGWHTETDDQGRLFIHKGGGLSAMQTQILAYPDQGLVIVWAHNNMARNWRRALNEGLSALALGDPYVFPPKLGAAESGTATLAGWWQTETGTRLELVAAGEGLSAGANGFGVPVGPLARAADGSWVFFDIERVTTFALSKGASGPEVTLEPEGEHLALIGVEDPGSRSAPLSRPTEEALDVARRVSTWLLSGAPERVWNVSASRPVRGAYSLADWTDKAEFIAKRVGGEVRVVEEAWVLRDGSWRYWRTFESASGMEVTLRFGLSGDGQVLSYGINPRGSEPDVDERRVVA